MSAKEQRCENCLAAQFAVQLEGALQETLALSRTPPRRVREARSEPAAAEVLKLRPALPPPNPVLPLAEPAKKLPPRAAEPGSRPRFRLITGGVLLATGIVLAGFGASGLSIAGQCSPDTPVTASECRGTYSSMPIGAALSGVGGGLALSGLILAVIPSKKAVKPPLMATAALR